VGLLHPVIAEAAMAMSSINVVSNANLLRFANVEPGYEAPRRREGNRSTRGEIQRVGDDAVYRTG
jgi:hypothetical protein